MSELLDSLIADLRKHVRAKDPTAIERAKQLAEQYPDEPKVWRLLAFAHEMNDDLDGAVAAVNRMMEVTPPQPAVFYIRGFYEHNRGNLHAALADFGRIGAGHIAELFEAAVVPIHTGVGALRAEIVEAKAFNRLHSVAGSAVLQR